MPRPVVRWTLDLHCAAASSSLPLLNGGTAFYVMINAAYWMHPSICWLVASLGPHSLHSLIHCQVKQVKMLFSAYCDSDVICLCTGLHLTHHCHFLQLCVCFLGIVLRCVSAMHQHSVSFCCTACLHPCTDVYLRGCLPCSDEVMLWIWSCIIDRGWCN